MMHHSYSSVTSFLLFGYLFFASLPNNHQRYHYFVNSFTTTSFRSTAFGDTHNRLPQQTAFLVKQHTTVIQTNKCLTTTCLSFSSSSVVSSKKIISRIYQPHQVQSRLKLCMVTSSSSVGATVQQTNDSEPGIEEKNDDLEDVPLPTVNGGYSHTTSSKAKISAANKGKVPWNKGRQRSEEEKARIADGVRRRNREKFLAKLVDLGLTEEEYEEQKKEERRKKDAERRARKTPKGGYTPTEETKAKISTILKEKWANGEMKKRSYTGPFRKGFSHSEETKEKIRQALKKKWAEDPEYQDKMRNTFTRNGENKMRKKISNTLKEKWKDPEFRAKMMERMKTRKKPAGGLKESQRKKISEAMKLKWQDEKYRNKTIEGMEKHRRTVSTTTRKPRKTTRTVQKKGIMQLTPTSLPKKKRKKKKATTTINGTASIKASRQVARPIATAASEVESLKPKTKRKKTTKKKKKKIDATASTEDGDIQRLREERRDLFDLLYGDDPGFLDNDDDDDDDFFISSSTAAVAVTASKSSSELLDNRVNGVGHTNGKNNKKKNKRRALSSLLGDNADFDDENLDDFDPYGLEDF